MKFSTAHYFYLIYFMVDVKTKNEIKTINQSTFFSHYISKHY